MKSLDCTVRDGARQREAEYTESHDTTGLRFKYRNRQAAYKSIASKANGNNNPATKKKAGTTNPPNGRVMVLENGKTRMRRREVYR